MTEQNTSELDQVNTRSAPSELRITDMRIAVVGGDGWRWPIKSWKQIKASWG
ncbi:MAG: hypothetical protein CM1200mP39_13130 [Dehalococcoidia bacterium]|nr:MAG: hypothetical protein CM1200mP39_13130 [Dehalococcoidia bacterium]